MNISIQYLCTIALAWICLTACDDNNTDHYSYIADPNVKTDIIEIKLQVNDISNDFAYKLQAKDLYIEWGDYSPHLELISRGNPDSIKPITHHYTESKEYYLKTKAVRLNTIELLALQGQYITELKLHFCKWLKKLDISRHPIPNIDLNSCPLLEELVCGHTIQTLSIKGLDQLSELRILNILGDIGSSALSLSENSRLQTFVCTQSNVPEINFSHLTELNHLSISTCPNLQQIILKNNPRIKTISLINNPLLDATALDALFDSLPIVNGSEHTILLRNNLGDQDCNRQVATAKGWIFIN